jgi:hypothetical protein
MVPFVALAARNSFGEVCRVDVLHRLGGMHTCFGTAIATMILGSVGQALFALDDLHEVSPMKPGGVDDGLERGHEM